MKKFTLKTDLKLKLPIVVIALLIFIGILSYQFTNSNFYIISTTIGVLSLIAVILSILGLMKSIKNLKRPKSKKTVFTLIALGALVCALLYLIVANIIDAIKYLT